MEVSPAPSVTWTTIATSKQSSMETGQHREPIKAVVEVVRATTYDLRDGRLWVRDLTSTSRVDIKV